jgi:hypothetical protein
MRIIRAFVIAAVSLGVLAIPAMASAGATPGAVHAVTHSAQHNDTTSGGPGTACTSSDNGPVWAIDNLSEHFTAVPVTGLSDGANWQVTIDVTGSFAGFADPNTCDALTSHGPVHGTIEYDVYSATPPDPASLLPNQAPDTGLGAALSQLFDGQPATALIVGGGDYYFSYQNGNYVQQYPATPYITGDVKGH